MTAWSCAVAGAGRLREYLPPRPQSRCHTHKANTTEQTVATVCANRCRQAWWCCRPWSRWGGWLTDAPNQPPHSSAVPHGSRPCCFITHNVCRLFLAPTMPCRACAHACMLLCACQEDEGVWVPEADSGESPEQQEQVPADRVLRIIETVYGQRQDKEHNPHGEHAHDVWQVGAVDKQHVRVCVCGGKALPARISQHKPSQAAGECHLQPTHSAVLHCVGASCPL